MLSDELIEDKGRAAAKSAIWYTVASFTTKGLGFITIPLFTRIMTTGEFADFNNFAAWQQILLSVFGMESYLTINRARFDFERNELQSYQFSTLCAGMLFSGILGLVLVVAPGIMEGITSLNLKYLVVMILYIVFYPAFAMYQSYQRVNYRYKLSALLSFSVSIAATCLSVTLVMFCTDALMGRVVGQYSPFIMLGILFFAWYAYMGKRICLRYIRYAVKLCIPLVVATCGAQILLLGCRIVTQHLCSSDDAAFVSLATTCSQIALVLITALNNAWAPWLMDCLNEGKYKSAEKTFSIVLNIILVVTLLVSLLSPELVLILGGRGYEPTVLVVPSLMSSCLLSMVASQYVYVETYHKKVRVGGIVTLVVGLVNLVICASLVRVFGFVGAGFSNTISYLILIAAHKIILRKLGIYDPFSFSILKMPVIASVISAFVLMSAANEELAVLRWLLSAMLLLLGAKKMIPQAKSLLLKRSHTG